MKKTEYKHIEEFEGRKNLLMFIQTLEEVLFYYAFESYKLPALNSHFLCFDLIYTKDSINQKSITEGNFIPLSEEFEDMVDNDIIFKNFLPTVDVMLKKRDKLRASIDYTKFDYKAKINKYSEAAEYMINISSVNNIYLNTLFNLLINCIFKDQCTYENLKLIYYLTRTLATELVNGGYSPEYIREELKRSLLNSKKIIKGNESELVDFFDRLQFEKKSYQISMGINASTANILRPIKNITVEKPSNELKKKLNLKHNRDYIVKLRVEHVDKFEAIDKAYAHINTIIGLHRISQHHKPVYIKPSVQIEEIDQDMNIISSHTAQIRKNILLRANNESLLQSYFFDDQLLNEVSVPENFFRAVSLHNSALDSKEATNQLLDLWTAVETLISFKTGDEDKISVICNVLTSILNRSYMFSQVEQLYKDIKAVLEKQLDYICNNISNTDSNIMKLAQIIAIKDYREYYNQLFGMLEEYPLLQYRLELFSKYIFKDSESVFNELLRHKKKLRWQIMRIYRNRNMIVHNGEHMPYLNIILGNLHYYVDSLFDVLIEYYHLGVQTNKTIFYDIEKNETLYWQLLGLDDKGKNVTAKEITETNYKEIIFNNYEGNAIKNVIKQAIEEMKKKKNSTKLLQENNT